MACFFKTSVSTLKSFSLNQTQFSSSATPFQSSLQQGILVCLRMCSLLTFPHIKPVTQQFHWNCLWIYLAGAAKCLAAVVWLTRAVMAHWGSPREVIHQADTAASDPAARMVIGMYCVTSAWSRRWRLWSPVWHVWPRSVRLTCRPTTSTQHWWSTSWSLRRGSWGRRSVLNTTNCWKSSVALTRHASASYVSWKNTKNMTLSQLQLKGQKNRWDFFFSLSTLM